MSGGSKTEEELGSPCWNCQNRSRYGLIVGDMYPRAKFLCSDCRGCPQGQQYALGSGRHGEPVFPPALPEDAITPWKLENQNFYASYGSAGVVGLVWSCTVLGHKAPNRLAWSCRHCSFSNLMSTDKCGHCGKPELEP